MRLLTIFIITLLLAGCKQEKQPPLSNTNDIENSLEFAQGFRILQRSNYTEIEIRNSAPGSDDVFRYALLDRERSASITLNKEDFDGIILTPVRSLIATSTTHIPALELLGVEDRLKGFPGTDYISSTRTRTLIDKGEVRELGTNEGINTESLIELSPDLLVGFSVSGRNRSYETVKKAGIPVILNGDWVEATPLAKAEWIKFFGLLFDMQQQADSIFSKIKTDYLKAMDIASHIEDKPVILSGAMYKDIWYLPGGSSPEAKFLEDANVDYIWRSTEASGSLSLSFETVFDNAKDADIWISPSNYKSKQAMLNSNERYAEFEAFKSDQIYSFTNVSGATGGILYYELGVSRPDLVLKDIIKICHPELLIDYEPVFFKPLP